MATHRWNPNDGYAMGFSVVDISPPDMPEMRSPQLSRPSSNLLIKLHGSAGWHFNTDKECAFVGMDALSACAWGRDQGGLPYEFKYEDLVMLYRGYLKFPGGRCSAIEHVAGTLVGQSFVLTQNGDIAGRNYRSCPFVFWEKLLGYFCTKRLLKFYRRCCPGWRKSESNQSNLCRPFCTSQNCRGRAEI
jgi:hypothetical protein